MNWIDIKTEKPPYGERVLISTIGDKTQNPPPRLKPDIAALILTSSTGDFWGSDDGFKPIGTVTHWMRLPDNPS